MPDLLTHALFAYAIGTLLSVRYEWLSPRYVTVVIAGSLLPDLNHISALILPGVVNELLGVPFSWGFLQTGGGVLVTVLIGVFLVPKEERRRAFGLLWLGAITHLLTDILIRTPDGRSQSVFWPLTQYQPPSPGLYTSGDLWPLAVAGGLALASWYFVRQRDRSQVSTKSR